MCDRRSNASAHPREVVEQHVLRREVERPVVSLRERVAVVVVRIVDAAARILVLEPRAADVLVLVDDDEIDAGLLQPVRGEQSRHARTDDENLELDIGCEVCLGPTRCAPVLTTSSELLLEQREVLAHLGAADRVLHDPQDVLVGRHRCRLTTCVAVADERLERELASSSLLLVGETSLRHRVEQRIRTKIVAEQGQVASDVRERGQQGRNLRVVERTPDLVVGLGDRLDGADERTGRQGRFTHPDILADAGPARARGSGPVTASCPRRRATGRALTAPAPRGRRP